MNALLSIGLLAGVLTTVTGVGGGMVALSLLSLLMAPAPALAISAAAFAIGNGHRVTMYARSVDRPVAVRFGLGLAAGAVAGAALVPLLPAAVLHAALVTVSVAALGKVIRDQLQRRRAASGAGNDREVIVAPGPPDRKATWSGRKLAGAGVVIGVIGAGAGGAGVLVSPVLLASGLRREAYVATVAASAITLNGARVVGYAAGGLYSATMLPSIAALAVALVLGNLLGRQIRQRMSTLLLDRIEVAAPMVAIAVTLLGG